MTVTPVNFMIEGSCRTSTRELQYFVTCELTVNRLRKKLLVANESQTVIRNI
jgi:hypothetical protein